MSRLGNADLRRAVELFASLGRFDDLDEMATHLVNAAAKLLPCDLVGYNEIAPGHGRLRAILAPDCAMVGQLEEAWTANQADHPTYQHALATGDGTAWRISDFLSTQQFHRTALYQECYRHIGCEAQVSITLDAPPGVIVALAFNRGRSDFSQADRELLNLVRPQLGQLYADTATRAAMTRQAGRSDAALAAIDDGMMTVDVRSRITWATSRARQLLATFFDAHPDSESLPPLIHQWLTNTGGDDAASLGREPLVVPASGDAGRLVVRTLSGVALGERLLVLAQRRRPLTSSLGLRNAFSLTAREADVLTGFVNGLSSPELARGLGCRPRTIEKHAENLFRKLGVTNRTAAVARAIDALLHEP